MALQKEECSVCRKPRLLKVQGSRSVHWYGPGDEPAGHPSAGSPPDSLSRLVWKTLDPPRCQGCDRDLTKAAAASGLTVSRGKKRPLVRPSGTLDSEEGGGERLPQCALTGGAGEAATAAGALEPVKPLSPFVLLLSGALFRCKLRVSALVAHACGCRRASDPSLWCSRALLRRRLRHRGDGSGWRACTRSATNGGGR